MRPAKPDNLRQRWVTPRFHRLKPGLQTAGMRAVPPGASMSQTPDILLTFAVKEEARPAQLVLSSRSELRVLITGIGEGNATRMLRAALANQPAQLVITSGFAGGLDPILVAGTVIFEADDEFPLSPALLSAATSGYLSGGP